MRRRHSDGCQALFLRVAADQGGVEVEAGRGVPAVVAGVELIQYDSAVPGSIRSHPSIVLLSGLVWALGAVEELSGTHKLQQARPA